MPRARLPNLDPTGADHLATLPVSFDRRDMDGTAAILALGAAPRGPLLAGSRASVPRAAA